MKHNPFPGTKAEDFDYTQKSPDGWASDYYVLPKGAEELGDLIEYRDMNFNVGNIFKACYRLGEKEGTTIEYDLNKIIYFAKRELRRHARVSNSNPFSTSPHED